MLHVARVSSFPAGPTDSEDTYQSLVTDRMSSQDLIVGIIFLLQTTIGLMGNFSLLVHFIHFYFSKCRLKSIDLILMHLTIANFLAILCKGVPKTMAALGWKDFLSDLGCRLLLYVHRVGRGVSFSSVSLLSVFQAITISTRSSVWAELKVKVLRCLGFSIFLCWILHMLVNIIFPMYVTGPWKNKSISSYKDYGYCSSVRNDKTADSLLAALLMFSDVVPLGLMTWASGSMVFILYRHKQRVQHLHRNNVSPRSSPETRATQTILVLVSTFVTLYTLSSTFQLLISALHDPSWWVLHTDALIGACFATVSPFILMSRDSSVSRFCFAWIRKTKSSSLIRNT
ncbi:vomeronasal type-1 receptor 4-like [Orycteropus afer afer]|uniref:Vomeronasal type-1 receptor n=1 Tax=Orycteropus afer afer TaxID=1230840 RepID=A0A8B7B9Q0_ORYAF|nr:vomeronasal type-1 receptor 4-like [Orycteropus afer afer]